MEIDAKLQKRVNIEMANNMPDHTDYQSYLPISQVYGGETDEDDEGNYEDIFT